MSTITIDNKITRENIVTAVSNVINQIKDDPKNGQVIFKAASELHHGLRGFFNVDDNVRPGFNEIEYTTTIATDETDDEKRNQLIYFAQNKCPVLDILQKPIPVSGKVQFSDAN